MAALGAIGTYGNELQHVMSMQIVHRIMSGGVQELLIGGREAVEGNPTLCLRIDTVAVYKLYWPVASGSRTFRVDVKQALNFSPRPRVTIKANSDIGVVADVTGSAGSSATWVTIGPLAAAPSSNGVLEVWLENLYEGGDDPIYWDNIIVT